MMVIMSAMAQSPSFLVLNLWSKKVKKKIFIDEYEERRDDEERASSTTNTLSTIFESTTIGNTFTYLINERCVVQSDRWGRRETKTSEHVENDLKESNFESGGLYYQRVRFIFDIFDV